MSEWILGGSTVVLVLVTIYYAWQTHQLTVQTTLQREDGMLPIVASKGFNQIHEANDPKDYCIHGDFINIGNGPALNLLVQFYDIDTEQLIAESKHRLDFLKAGESQESTIHLPIAAFKKIKFIEEGESLRGAMKCMISYNDIRGNLFSSRQDLSFNKAAMRIRAIEGTLMFSRPV